MQHFMGAPCTSAQIAIFLANRVFILSRQTSGIIGAIIPEMRALLRRH
jgi:hypothetical protein